MLVAQADMLASMYSLVPAQAPVIPQSSYDVMVMGDSPVFYLRTGSQTSEKSLAGSLSAAYYGSPATTSMPNGDTVSLFDGRTQYLEVPDDPSLSVTTTGILTVEAWMRPDTLTFPVTTGTGYVYALGKKEISAAEWAVRMYSQGNTDGLGNQLGAFVYDTGGVNTSGTTDPGPFTPGQWLHVVGVINTVSGYTKLYVNNVLQGTTTISGVTPGRTSSPLRIGTAHLASFWQGGLGKVAIYNTELSAARVTAHYNQGL